MHAPSWLHNAVFYNIYPQSFCDTNGDGIGDLNGISSKLDYIQSMGFDAIWLNPIYVSPFRDAGYDVTDFYKVAPRYGTNEDFVTLAAEAKKRGIKVVLDLVAGHTSLECAWFGESAKPEKNRYSNRYIWSNSVWDTDGGMLISGYSDRDGCYMKNFFYCQPALNYGFKTITQPWQLPMDHPDCLDTREELLNIMRFWSDLGADGFRVDLASSLVKNDPTAEGVIELWNDVTARYYAEYPDNILISEWCHPINAIKAGFDIDFLIHSGLKAYTTLFRYEAGTSANDLWVGESYFRRAGNGDIAEFLTEYLEHYHATKDSGYISIPTGNHDIPRISYGRDTEELKAAYVFIMTLPGVPFVYYGDEIGMRYLAELPSKEGGYNRTGARTPMQWDNSKNYGFSAGDTLYLPVDPSTDAPTVADQLADPQSLLRFTKDLIALRKSHPALMADGGFEPLAESGYPFAYKRTADTETVVVAVNPSDKACTLTLPKPANILLCHGVSFDGDTAAFDGVSYVVYTA